MKAVTAVAATAVLAACATAPDDSVPASIGQRCEAVGGAGTFITQESGLTVVRHRRDTVGVRDVRRDDGVVVRQLVYGCQAVQCRLSTRGLTDSAALAQCPRPWP